MAKNKPTETDANEFAIVTPEKDLRQLFENFAAMIPANTTAPDGYLPVDVFRDLDAYDWQPINIPFHNLSEQPFLGWYEGEGPVIEDRKRPEKDGTFKTYGTLIVRNAINRQFYLIPQFALLKSITQKPAGTGVFLAHGGLTKSSNGNFINQIYGVTLTPEKMEAAIENLKARAAEPVTA